METFLDANGGEVRLSFKKGAFGTEPRHVLVICRYGDQWLLTNHKERGWEFPGGKREQGESIEEAARREVYEETGAHLNSLDFIGEYEVNLEKERFVKAIFFADVKGLNKTDQYFETNGPILTGGNLLEDRRGSQYSFIMKDKVVEKSLEKILERK
ncbi:7,8-dihydro-8-oxoguanine-triphosphatase [Sporosarcina globispora]|uniref:7,8-dihydro-8-oxoguanine-triphosphatase n=1 Tax=Sporosarcina globispora TaxID=1459 RepID=A0A0M0G9S1_SPOGL|nr:nucleoside triphosphatase YtkD [Sporosarcina globispora]KON86655.1 7,8-dihydro-8-oxoguanine-triphosphatase [Sporosarcina globispora]